MSNVTISKQEYLELQNAKAIMQRLESAGVDNWEGYDIALDGYVSKEELYKEAEEFLNEISADSQVDYPAGREAGHMIIFSDKAVEMVVELLKARAN